MKISLALAGVVLLGTTLAACGGSDGGDGNSADGSYCKDIKAAKKTFGSVESADASKLGEAFDTFHKLAAEAPSKIKTEWGKIDDAITSVEDALDDAGIKPSDFDDLQAGKIPDGVDTSKLAGLATKLQELSSSAFNDATDAISKNAKSECDVDLSSTS